MIELQEVSVRYGEFSALSDLSLVVSEGECVALVGPSGCGKTSALRSMNGMVRCAYGLVRVGDRPLAAWNLPELRRRMGYVIQDVGLLPHWTIERNVEAVPVMLGWSESRRRERIRKLLSEVGLSDTLRRKLPAQLSGGQRQRVGLARALAAEPSWLLMDEPFGACDPLTRVQLRRLMRELLGSRSVTTVLVTHDLEDAFRLADRIAVLKQGRLVQVGTPKELLEHPEDAWVREFIEAGRTQTSPLAGTEEE